MSALNPLHQPVQWFEGMLLSPQHFQQHDLYVEELMFHQLQRTTPFFYGLMSLTFDLSELSANKVVVTSVHAVMPDGTVVDYDQGSPIPGSQSEHQDFSLRYTLDDQIGDKAFLYLAVAKRSAGNNNGAEEKLKRFDSYNAGKVSDLFDGNNQVDIVRLRTKLQLLTEGELSENYSYFPILKLSKTSNGKFTVLDYTPPQLAFAPLANRALNQTDLWHEVEHRIAMLRLRASERLNHLKHQVADGSAINYHQKMDLHYVTKCLPGLKIMLNSRKCHPFDVYVALVDLISSMAIMQDEILPRDYKDYKHNDIYNVLKPLLEDIDVVLTKMALNFNVQSFEKDDSNVFTYAFSQWPDSNQFMLAFKLSAGVSRKQLESWIKAAFICSDDKRTALMGERLMGGHRQHVTRFAEIDLVESDDELLYVVTKDRQWFSGTGAKDPVLHISISDDNLNEYAPEAINLYQVNQEGG